MPMCDTYCGDLLARKPIYKRTAREQSPHLDFYGKGKGKGSELHLLEACMNPTSTHCTSSRIGVFVLLSQVSLFQDLCCRSDPKRTRRSVVAEIQPSPGGRWPPGAGWFRVKSCHVIHLYAGVSMSWFCVPCPDCLFRVTTCHD